MSSTLRGKGDSFRLSISDNKMEEIRRKSMRAKAITPFDKEITEKLNKVEFKVDIKRKVEIVVGEDNKIEEFIK